MVVYLDLMTEENHGKELMTIEFKTKSWYYTEFMLILKMKIECMSECFFWRSEDGGKSFERYRTPMEIIMIYGLIPKIILD